MTRYYVASAGDCEAVRQAINTAHRAGPAQYAERRINGVLVRREPIAEWEARTGRPVGWLQLLPADRLIVAGADAALELPDDDGLTWQHISDQLGKTIGGVPTPRADSLVQVTRAREHSLLPAGVRDVLDDRWIDGQLDGTDGAGQPRDTPQARAAITAELQGARATAALERKDVRGTQAALDRAMGLGGGMER